MIWLLACTQFTLLPGDDEGFAVGAPSDGAFFPDSGDVLCTELTGGALFTVAFDTGERVLWIEDDRFIDWIASGQTSGTPLFGGIVDEPLCDDFSWAPDPSDAEFSDATVGCDASPPGEEPPEAPWCPSMQVLDWEDRR